VPLALDEPSLLKYETGRILRLLLSRFVCRNRNSFKLYVKLSNTVGIKISVSFLANIAISGASATILLVRAPNPH